MKAAFTPGPWEYWSHVSSVAKGRRVGKVAEISLAYKGSAERDANGFLIAAAPELYGALSDLMENPEFVVAVGGNPNVVDRLMDRTRAALAKARGES